MANLLSELELLWSIYHSLFQKHILVLAFENLIFPFHIIVHIFIELRMLHLYTIFIGHLINFLMFSSSTMVNVLTL